MSTAEATTAALTTPLTLRCGQSLPNRIAKAAMSEQLGDFRGAPTVQLERLYRRWGAGGAGLLITGNVMVDRRSLGEPRNVVVEDERDLDGLRRWAQLAKAGGAKAIVQLNHPGRQTPQGLSTNVVAPSAVPVAMGGAFPKPRAMAHDEILEQVERFATTARIVVEAGFDGVQLHAAHGYLLSQFLSPRVNQRDDDWGGDAVRRRRFLLEVARATREAMGPEAILAVKLNSADFQRGGFDEDESLDVIAALDSEGIDLLEVSGGTYEQPEMTGTTRASTAAREAYFLDFAERAKEIAAVPLMVTGGFRSGTAMAGAVAGGGADVVGLARPLALEPELSRAVLDDPEGTRAALDLKTIGVRRLDAAADLWWTQHQIARLGDGKEPDPRYGARRAVVSALLRDGVGILRSRRGR